MLEADCSCAAAAIVCIESLILATASKASRNPCCVSFALSIISPITSVDCLVAFIDSFVSFCNFSIRSATWWEATFDSSANFLTSSATTAKPRPASPALAASMAAFRARRFVWLAMFLIVFTNSDIARTEEPTPAMLSLFCLEAFPTSPSSSTNTFTLLTAV